MSGGFGCCMESLNDASTKLNILLLVVLGQLSADVPLFGFRKRSIKF